MKRLRTWNPKSEARSDDRNLSAVNFVDLESMIAAGDPNDHDHIVLLLASAACGWEEPVRLLLERGCPINRGFSAGAFEAFTHKDPEQQTHYPAPSALSMAAHRGHLCVVKLLLQPHAGLIQEKKDRDLVRPLALAIAAGHMEIVSTFLDYGVNPDSKVPIGQAVIFSAIRRPEIFELLLDRGAAYKNISADPFRDGGADEVENLLDIAIFQGAKKEVQLFLKRLDGHNIPVEELDQIVARLETRSKEHDREDILPLLHHACCRKRYHELIPMPSSV